MRFQLALSEPLALFRLGSLDEARPTKVRQVGLGVIRLLPHHQRVHLKQMAVFLYKMPEGAEHRALAVVSGAERNEDGFLDRRASERVTQRPPKVSHQALRAVEIVFRCARSSTHHLNQKRKPSGTCRRRSVSVPNELRNEVRTPVFAQFARAQIDRAVQEIQRERVRVEFGGADIDFAFSHREHAADAAGVE